MQGFRKVDPDKWEFANEFFLRGQTHLLKNIRRRRSHSHPQSSTILDPCVEVGSFGLDAEVDQLRRDKQVLIAELVKLRQQQQSTRSYVQDLESRLGKTEQKQHRMMNFLAKAMKNPEFFQQIVQQKDRRAEMEEVMCRKRRRLIEQGTSQGTSQVQFGVENLGEVRGKEVASEERDKELDEGFWRSFLSDKMEEEHVLFDGEFEGEEDVDVLVEQLK